MRTDTPMAMRTDTHGHIRGSPIAIYAEPSCLDTGLSTPAPCPARGPRLGTVAELAGPMPRASAARAARPSAHGQRLPLPHDRVMMISVLRARVPAIARLRSHARVRGRVTMIG